MTSSQKQVLAKLQEYAKKIEETDYDTESANGERSYETCLNKALQQLQEQVMQHQVALERVRRLRKTFL